MIMDTRGVKLIQIMCNTFILPTTQYTVYYFLETSSRIGV